MSGTWTKQGEEPTLENFFADPIVDLLLRRDGITQSDVWQAIDNARPCVDRRRGIRPEVMFSPEWRRPAA
ncbi:hypothetical protein [Pelagibius sp. Alg239-R121]|uniref:hypothetical protein n=1 Tax=Pelagibius sp. Alg239-R121 TaxID=2993448 RepID=UPI0024A74BC5|nr:hypothetical protein [Pelagibius sp. Alg239-R121]